MMSILVVGSVAFDTVETQHGRVEMALGGSATYFSIAASPFAPVRLVGVVGEDFPDEHVELLASKGVDIEGLQRRPGKTFFWAGRYSDDFTERETLDTQLNVFNDFNPDLPEQYRNSHFIFLGNIDPDLQLQVLDQVDNPKLVACDTMNYWIHGKPERLKKVLSRIQILLINDSEVKDLSGEHNLLKGAKAVLGMGPRALIVKRGEYGALLFADDRVFWAPAFPLEDIVDPTGAGDSFAGGFMGALAAEGEISVRAFRRAVVYGSVVASFNVEDFSLGRLRTVTRQDIEKRFAAFMELTQFD